MYLDNEFIINILNDLNTLSCHSNSDSNTIELTVHTSCCWGRRLTLCYYFFELEASNEKLNEPERQVSTELNENTALVVTVLQVRDSFLGWQPRCQSYCRAPSNSINLSHP